MRGKGLRHIRCKSGIGITPACAGKRGHRHRVAVADGDHPRVCGEKICEGLGCRGALGSPPRVRGKDTGAFLPSAWRGITPACAGKRRLRRRFLRPLQDHPRVCGEKVVPVVVVPVVWGSPPRVRGKGKNDGSGKPGTRITPACAGKSHDSPEDHREWQDHPRVCGEKYLQLYRTGSVLGSPPRVRGKD